VISPYPFREIILELEVIETPFTVLVSVPIQVLLELFQPRFLLMMLLEWWYPQALFPLKVVLPTPPEKTFLALRSQNKIL